MKSPRDKRIMKSLFLPFLTVLDLSAVFAVGCRSVFDLPPPSAGAENEGDPEKESLLGDDSGDRLPDRLRGLL